MIGFSLISIAGFGQIDGSQKRYVRVGSLQSHFSAYGSERAWNNSYYEGLIWPADYPFQDNSVIKRAWAAVQNFQDENGVYWPEYGIYYTLAAEGVGLFPMELRQTSSFKPPDIYVDGDDLNIIFAGEIDDYDMDQLPDRIITNVVNSSMGLTMTRRIYAFTQQYHDNYFIKEFTFTNTGNIDSDPEIELSAPLTGVRIGWGTRYSMGREASWTIGDGQSWGKHTWVTRRGEDYSQHYLEAITPENPIVDWLRAGFSWAGQGEKNTFDNIGGPDLLAKGRLTSPHHTGSVVLHVDRAANDHNDWIEQPVFLGWHAGDTYPDVGDQRVDDAPFMSELYDMLSGTPYGGSSMGGQTRMDEENLSSITDPIDPWKVHGDGGGTNVMMTYGPFDLALGESITIVEAEAINGLSREMCELIGERWKTAYDTPGDNGPFELPDGSETSDMNVYKNSWVYTGKDSLMLSFGRAKRNYDSGFNIPRPPLPPASFTVESGGDRIYTSWLPSPSEANPDFGGYRLYRAIGKPDTSYTEIFACGLGTAVPELTYYFDDTTPLRGQAYYYYVLAFDDGSNNNTDLNPRGSLHSSRFYTKTSKAATLKRKAGAHFDQIRIVPNPYNIRQEAFIGQPDKLAFYDIPGVCTIRIYTERGDLIKTIDHDDGSGDESWLLSTDMRQVIVSGIYIAHFEKPDGTSTYRKFIVVR